MNWILYSGDWMEMPVSVRKMVITMMSFGQDMPSLRAAPFYVVNRELVAEVRRTG